MDTSFWAITLELFKGFWINFKLFGITLLCALPLGLILSFGSMSKFKPLKYLVKVLVWIIRGTPLMLQIIVVFYGPGLLFGMQVGNDYRFKAALIAFIINYSCYFSEIYRGGIESIPKGQQEAGLVLGMTKSQIFFKVTLLQVVKNIVPPMSNEIITLVKDTSLARTIAIIEVIRVGEDYITGAGLFWPLFYTGAFYLVFCGILTLLFGQIEKSFGKNEILKGISFDLQKGEVLSIIGSSGSGKTTLLRCINFLEFAESGTITVNGEMIYDGVVDKKIKEKDLRKKRLHFGLVFQDFNLFPQYDVLQNLTLAPSLLKMGTKEELEVGAKEIIKKVGLEDRINHYPCQLSGGQKQRVAIARALMLKPDILCFDEPTSALDPELTGEVLKVIKSLKTGNSTMIVVTHEMDFAKNVSDKVIFMADGVIEEYGEPKQLFENPKSDKLKAFLNNALDV